jgi:hypothetical protein
MKCYKHVFPQKKKQKLKIVQNTIRSITNRTAKTPNNTPEPHLLKQPQQQQQNKHQRPACCQPRTRNSSRYDSTQKIVIRWMTKQL